MGLKKNFIYNTLYQVILMLLPLITVPYVSRVLGPRGVGDYAYTFSYSQYFVLIGMIGISLYGSKSIACVKKDKIALSKRFFSIYSLQFLMTITVTIVYVIIFASIKSRLHVVFMLQAIIVGTSIFDISWLFIGIEDMRSIVFRNSIAKIIGVLSIFLFVKNYNDIGLYTFILAFSSLVGQFTMWIKLFKIVDIKEFKVDLRESTIHLRPALALFVSQIAVQIYTLLDRSMLGIMSNVSEVGLYDNAQKTIKLALMLITSLGTIMLPRMSFLYSEGRIDEFKEMIYKVFSYINFMVFPMMFGLIGISKSFSVWFYGTQFTGIAILLQLGSVLMFAISWGNILGIQILLPMNKENKFTIAVICGAIINFIINLLLIGKYRAIGTTIASIIAEFTVTGIELYMVKNFIDIKNVIKLTIKPIIGSFIMLAVIIILDNVSSLGILSTLIQIAIGTIVYVTIMFILKDRFMISVIDIMRNKLKKE